MAVSTTAVAVDSAFNHESVAPVNFDAIDSDQWMEDKVVGAEAEDEGLDNDPPDEADSEQDPAEVTGDEGEEQDPSEAEDGDAEQPDELPAEDSAQPERLLADEFGTALELEIGYVQLKQNFGEQSRALEAQREMTLRLQLQAGKVPEPALLRFDALSAEDQQKVANLALSQGYEDPQTLLRDHWRDQLRDAKAHNAAIDRAAQEHDGKFSQALTELGAYVNQEKHKPYAQAIESEWAAHPELFEALQMMPPGQMLQAAKHFTDLVVRAAAADERQKVFDKEALRSRQQGREEHRHTRRTKLAGATEASRPNTVTVTKPKPKAAEASSASRVRSKLAELDEYERHDRIS